MFKTVNHTHFIAVALQQCNKASTPVHGATAALFGGNLKALDMTPGID
jgi:hypothetical protein